MLKDKIRNEVEIGKSKLDIYGNQIITTKIYLEPEINIGARSLDRWTGSCFDDIGLKTREKCKQYFKKFNSETLKEYGARIMWDEGFSNEYIEIFKDNSKPYTTIKEFLVGFRAHQKIDYDDGPFTKIFFDSLKENLKKNDISYKIYFVIFEIYKCKGIRLKEQRIYKKIDITNFMIHIVEKYVSSAVRNMQDVNYLKCCIEIETSITF